MNNEIRNAKITDVSLVMGEHGCLTYWLMLNFDGYICGYGGFCLGHGYLGAKEFDASAKGLEAMMRIMNVVGVERWEDMEGKYIRIVDRGLGNTVDTIGHIMEDKWFNQREFFAETSGGKQ